MGLVGLSKCGRFGRWNKVYSNGESKPVSWLWNIVPSPIRSYWLLYRHLPSAKTFDEIREDYDKRNMHNTMS